MIAVASLSLLATACAVDPVTDATGAPRSRDASDGTALLRVGNAAAASGDQAAAAGYYRRAHGLNPRSIMPLLGLAKALYKLGAYDQSSEAFRTALSLEPENVEALLGLGNALIGLNRPQLAIGHFENALSRAEEVRAYNGLGVAYDTLGDHTMAQVFYGTGLKIEPGNLTLRNNFGLSLAIAGKFKKAIDVLRRAAADPRAGPRHRLNLALAYGLAGQVESAAEIARVDLDEAAVRRNLAYYRTLRALNDTRATFEAIGVHGFVAGSSGIKSR